MCGDGSKPQLKKLIILFKASYYCDSIFVACVFVPLIMSMDKSFKTYNVRFGLRRLSINIFECFAYISDYICFAKCLNALVLSEFSYNYYSFDKRCAYVRSSVLLFWKRLAKQEVQLLKFPACLTL